MVLVLSLLTTAVPLQVSKQDSAPLAMTLAKSGGKFSGKLTNPAGEKIGQAWLTVFDAATGTAVADERICECSGEFHTPVPAGTYLLLVERHGLSSWYGGGVREQAVPLTAVGEISGLDMIIEENAVVPKQVPPNGRK